jgi:NADH-quinone oxidoreductase subunit L
VGGGAIGTLHALGPLGRWLRPAVQAGVPAPSSGALVPAGTEAGLAFWGPVVLGVAVSLAGILIGWLAYGRRAIRGRARALGSVLAHRFYVEDAYDAAVISPVEAAAHGAARFDRGVIDLGVVGVAEALTRSGAVLRRLQTGYLRQYAAFVLIGVLAILAYWIWR